MAGTLKDYNWILNEATQGTLTLEYDPINWATLQFSLKRSNEFQGITRRFSSDAEFFGDAYDFISAVYEDKGVNGVIDIEAQILNRTTQDYETLFTGRINLANYNIQESELGLFTVLTNIEETGFERQFIDNINTEVNLFQDFSKNGLPLDSLIPTGVFLRSYPITRRYEATNSGNPVADLSYLYNRKVLDGEFRYFYVYPANDVTVRTVRDTFEYGPTILLEPPENYNFFFLKAQEDGDYTFDLQGNVDVETEIQAQGAGGDDDLIRLTVTGFVTKADGTVINSSVLANLTQASGQNLTATNLNYTYNNTLSLNVGDEIFFYIEVSGETVASGGAGLNDKVRWLIFEITLNSVQYNIDAKTTFLQTICSSVFVKTAFERIVNIITDQEDKVISDFLDISNPEGQDVLTNGYILRGVNFNTQPIRATFFDLWQSLWMKYNIGFGIINDEVVIEPTEFFYDDTVIFTINSKLNEFKKRAATEYYYNNITIGYAKWQVDDSNDLTGALEYNGKRTYQTPVKFVENPLEIVSPYVSANYAIESTRREQIQNIEESESTRFDEDNFIIRTVFDIIRRNATDDYFLSVVGVEDSDKAYNLDHLPTKCLYAHLNTLSHTLYKQPNSLLRYQITGREGTPNGISTNGNGVTAFEDLDVNVDPLSIPDIPEPIFIPEIFTFQTPVSFQNFQTIQNNRYGLIEFIDPETQLPRKGWILNLDYNFEERIGVFELISNTDIVTPP